MTIAVTEKGKVFAIGDKLAKMAKLDNSKFGFYEVPLSSPETEYVVEEPFEEPLVYVPPAAATVGKDGEEQKEEAS